MEMNIQEINDRLKLKQLVDLFSNYADTKENEKQVQLFTSDGEVNIINNGKVVFKLKGRKAIYDAFSKSMEEYETVFHMSGQQTITFIDEMHAEGIAYNYVFLENAQSKVQEGVRYEDRYVKVDGKWLIEKRDSHFIWHK